MFPYTRHSSNYRPLLCSKAIICPICRGISPEHPINHHSTAQNPTIPKTQNGSCAGSRRTAAGGDDPVETESASWFLVYPTHWDKAASFFTANQRFSNYSSSSESFSNIRSSNPVSFSIRFSIRSIWTSISSSSPAKRASSASSRSLPIS